jgi:hypothetical protein
MAGGKIESLLTFLEDIGKCPNPKLSEPGIHPKGRESKHITDKS